MLSTEESQQFIKLLCDALVYGKNRGLTMQLAEDGFQHTLLHVYLLNLTETPPIPDAKTKALTSA
jgi:hypothetical protein